MKVTYNGAPCYHAGTGLDLMPGEIDVSEEQAAQLAGLVTKVDEAPSRRKRGEPREEE